LAAPEEILCQNDDADVDRAFWWKKTTELLEGMHSGVQSQWGLVVSRQLASDPRDFWRAQRRRSICKW